MSEVKLLNAAELGDLLGISRSAVYRRRSLGEPFQGRSASVLSFDGGNKISRRS